MACKIDNPFPGPTEDPGPDEWDYKKGEPRVKMSTTNDEQAPLTPEQEDAFRQAGERGEAAGTALREALKHMPSAYDAGNALNQATMDKPTERAPLFPTEEMLRHIGKKAGQLDDYDHHYRSGFILARNFYEAKIASGELRVVKKVTNTARAQYVFACSQCTEVYAEDVSHGTSLWNFCPGCGAQITK